MKRFGLFIIASLFGGAGGALGSMIGHSFGKGGIWVGGILGGVVASVLAARVALWRRWIGEPQLWPTTFGAIVGFFLACIIVVNTLSSPVGPIISTMIIGAGALLGARINS